MMCLYFFMDKVLTDDVILYLDGDNKGGIVNNCCFFSNVVFFYVLFGKVLVFVFIIGVLSEDDVKMEVKVCDEFFSWFGDD